MADRPRPEGFNYSIPDPIAARCKRCNPDGMNRTGLKTVAYVGASVTSMYGIRCPILNCHKGLIDGTETAAHG